jgi:tetratricopeptide (TPR) repeat protein
MLKRLAEHKLRRGDIKGAVRCFEEVLKLSDDKDTNSRLRELYRKHSATLAGQERRTVLPILVLLIGAPITGACIGMVDYLVGDQEVSIFLVILSWIPLVVGIYLAGIVLSSVLEWALVRYRFKNLSFGISLAAVSAGLAAYGLPEGRIMAEYLSSTLSGPIFESLGEAVQATGAILTRGGAWFIRDAIRNGGTAGVIYVFILLAALAYFVVSGFTIVRSLTLQRQRIEIAQPTSTSLITRTEMPGWLSVAVVLIGAGMFIALFINAPELPRGYSAVVRHAELADQLYMQGDLDGAASELEKAISIDPDEGILYTNLGWVYLSQGKFSEAQHAFQNAIHLGELSAETYLGLGYAHLALENYAAALPSLTRVIEINPPDDLLAQAYFAKASISSAEEDHGQAILDLEEAVRLAPGVIEYQISLAWTCVRDADLDRALQAFQSILRHQPENVDAAMGLAHVQLALRNYEEAEAEFEALVEMNINDLRLSEAYFGLSEVYGNQNDLPNAIKYLELSINLTPDPNTRIALIFTLIRMGEFDKALDQCDTLIADRPEWTAPVAIKAFVYLRMGQMQAGESLLVMALSLEGEDLESAYMLGIAYIEARRFREAEQVLQRAIDLAPREAVLKLYLVSAYGGQDKYDEALEAIERLLEEDDESVDAYIGLASLLLDQEEVDRGLETYLTALDLEPEEAAVHSGLSFTYFHLGQIDEALAAAREAIRIDPYSTSAYKNLAFAYQAQGNCESAVEAAQEAIRLFPTNDSAHYILGVCYMEMGENEKAVEAFESFLSFYIDRGFIREYKAQAEAFLEELQ